MKQAPEEIDALWRRLEDAKLQLDLAHNYLKEVKKDRLSGDIPAPDADYAYGHALGAEQAAVEHYLLVLNTYKATVYPDAEKSAGLAAGGSAG